MDTEEKIYRGYDWAYQRVHNYDRLLAQNTNIFLLSSSILFTGFILIYFQLNKEFNVILVIVTFIGIFLALQYMISSIRGVRDISYWIRVCRTLEETEESFTVLKEKDLVYIGYIKWINGMKNKYTRENKTPPYKSDHLNKFEKLLASRYNVFHQWTAYRYIIPISFLALWISVLVWIS